VDRADCLDACLRIHATPFPSQAEKEGKEKGKGATLENWNKFYHGRSRRSKFATFAFLSRPVKKKGKKKEGRAEKEGGARRQEKHR